LSKITFEGNKAVLYGDVIATLPKTFSFDLKHGTPSTSFVPGIEPLYTSVILQDDRDNTVRDPNFICRSRVCVSPLSACGDQDSLVTPEFHLMDSEGRIRVRQARVPCSQRSGAVILQISLVLYDKVLSSTSSIQCLPCTRGQSRVLDRLSGVWYCVACANNQYILDNNNPAFSCQECPIGAICDGNSLMGKVEDSVWRQDNRSGLFILEACPLGYEMIASDGSRDSLTQLLQQCSSCSAAQYILNASYRCQQCPIGAICNGITLSSRVSGSIWVPDFTLGQYLLTGCPPGYQIDLAGRANLALQQCSLCPAGSYCIGDAASGTQCPTGTFAPAGSNTSAACYRAVFVQLAVVLPCAKPFFETKQATFAVCVASTVGVSTDDVVVDQVIPTTYRRIGGTGLAVQVQSRIVAGNKTAAAQLLSSITETNLNFELLSRGLPAAKILSLAILTSADSSDARDRLILAFCLIIGCLLLTGVAAAYSIMKFKQKSKEERELDAAMSALRVRLKLDKANGFFLHTERVSLLADTKYLVFINKNYLEAAARIMLSDDFNLMHFDALCNCLECHDSDVKAEAGASSGKNGSSQCILLCDWILEVCKALIDPGLEGQPEDPKWKPARERFVYFEKVCAAQIWKSNDGQLFERLKCDAGSFLDQIARMCNERFEQIMKEPGGSDLVGMSSWPGQEEVREDFWQYPEYFDSSTPATLLRNMDRM
jgi:hypothetical protein